MVERKHACMQYTIWLPITCLQTVNFFFIDARRDSPVMTKAKESEYGEKVKCLVHMWTGALAGNHPGE